MPSLLMEAKEQTHTLNPVPACPFLFFVCFKRRENELIVNTGLVYVYKR